MKHNATMSPPWLTYYNEIAALLKKDPDVKTEYDVDARKIKIYVKNQDKADALTNLLPAEKNFGGQILTIEVIPANAKKDSLVSLFKRAFDGNPIVKEIVTVEDTFSFDSTYIVFTGDIVQFYNDELDDLNGMLTVLYQDLAKELFYNLDAPIFFCTEKLS